MSVKVENSYQMEDEAMQQRAHYIPCRVAEDGSANVQQYFEPYVVKDQNGGLTASLRGRPLDGVEMCLPDSHRAVLLTESRQPLAEDAPRKFQVSGGFTSLVYWNYDKKPSKNDTLANALDWIDIAEAIHGD